MHLFNITPSLLSTCNLDLNSHISRWILWRFKNNCNEKTSYKKVTTYRLKNIKNFFQAMQTILRNHNTQCGISRIPIPTMSILVSLLLMNVPEWRLTPIACEGERGRAIGRKGNECSTTIQYAGEVESIVFMVVRDFPFFFSGDDISFFFLDFRMEIHHTFLMFVFLMYDTYDKNPF